MTDERLRKIYDVARYAVYAEGDPSEGMYSPKVGKALDVVIAYCDARQAGMMDWAIANGFPDFETVVLFGSQ